jgi:hypothetical protein
VLLQLNAAGFGAPVLATFVNGRVEGWLYARPLEPEELSNEALSRRIARTLRRFHAAPVDGSRAPALWPLVRQWLAMAASLQLDDPARQAKLEAVRATPTHMRASRLAHVSPFPLAPPLPLLLSLSPLSCALTHRLPLRRCSPLLAAAGRAVAVC